MSAKELAPTEDQGVIFGIVNTPANSTLDQLIALDQGGEPGHLVDIPETQFTFQITFPSGGFWGDGLKPWDQRKRNVGADPPRGAAKRVAVIPGIQTFAVLAARAARRRQLPHRVRHRLDGRDREVLEFARQLSGEGGGQERAVRLPAAHRREARPAAVGDR